MKGRQCSQMKTIFFQYFRVPSCIYSVANKANEGTVDMIKVFASSHGKNY